MRASGSSMRYWWGGHGLTIFGLACHSFLSVHHVIAATSCCLNERELMCRSGNREGQ